MRAITVHAHGGAEAMVLESDFADPVAGEGM